MTDNEMAGDKRMRFWQAVIIASLAASFVRVNSAHMPPVQDVVMWLVFIAVHGAWWRMCSWIFFSDSDGSPEGGDACGSVHDSAAIAQPSTAKTSVSEG